ncbi:MAG: HAD family hydrolase [Chloroflexota bacterium]
MIDVIAFDGDDTLWHNESIFSVTQERFRTLLARYVPGVSIDERLFAMETRNLRLFGYGIKGFTLSMIETAIEVTDSRVSASDIQTIIDSGKSMLEHPVELLDGVPSTLASLAPDYRLMVITKGDLFDQESKLARSGLADMFWKIEILSEKDPEAYRRILSRYEVSPANFLMVGNSMRSDILPVVEVGGRAVHIPYHVTWSHEVVETTMDHDGRVYALESIDALPDLVQALNDERRPARG